MRKGEPHRLTNAPFCAITPHCNADLLPDNKPTAYAPAATSDDIEQQKRGRERTAFAPSAPKLVGPAQPISALHKVPIKARVQK
jgi:hypothetical protein